uniref:AlNc14C162G7795 protein n=1 Tax=Albugo laibachii Nc14 TaxID=890382 RepID=F0WMV9_9STRA|nr:AlNc14C162G7795 [Albugo laibachii Nc14]|eukprot:CCA22644.1 AlNc14C162G7795 [Albugo laibachii Nc14]
MFNINGPSGPVQRCERRVIQAFDKVTNKSKRQKQNTTARTEPKAELFKGCYVVFNGRTGKVSSYFLANLVEEHGGNVRRPGIKFARITHVIGSNLNGSKTHKLIQVNFTEVKHITYPPVRPHHSPACS